MKGIRADKVNDNGDFYAQTVKGIYKHYEEACLNDSLVDFAELLLKAYELVKTNKTVKEFFTIDLKLFWLMSFKTLTPFNITG
jgi:DNA helicase-2/ATP-dependent DNA helicase PcrA